MAEHRQTYTRGIDLDYRGRFDIVKYADRPTVEDVIRRVNIYNLAPGVFMSPETTNPPARHRLNEAWQVGNLYKVFETDKFNGVELHFFRMPKYLD